jgi:HSP20 family protein
MFQRPTPSRGAPAHQRGGAVATRGHGMPSLFGGDDGPFALLRQLDEDMNRLFDEFYGGRSFGAEGAPGWMPQVEVQEREGKLHVCADLPGMSKDDVKVDLADGQLTIQGERRRETSSGQEPGQGYYRSERSYGSFYRSIPLPEGIDVDSAQASFRDGVLDVCFDAPKESSRGARRLEISEGASSGGAASASSSMSSGAPLGGAMSGGNASSNAMSSGASLGSGMSSGGSTGRTAGSSKVGDMPA